MQDTSPLTPYRDGTGVGSDGVVRELVKSLVFEGNVTGVLQDCAVASVIRNRAENLGVNATTQEIQDRADAWRRSMGLLGAQETVQFLERFNLDLEDLEEYNEFRVLRNKLKNELFEEQFLRTVFERNRESLRAFRLLVIQHGDKSKPAQLRDQLARVQSAFREYAKEWSAHESRYCRGELGLKYRHQLSSPLFEEMMGVSEGDFLGPLEQSGNYRLYRVEEILPPRWNRRLKDHLRMKLFKAWLREGLVLQKLR